MNRIFCITTACAALLAAGCTKDDGRGPLMKEYTALIGEATGHASCITVTYRVSGDLIEQGARYGICWNTQGNPTLDDDFLYGPQKPDGGAPLMQVIPNTLLAYGTTYHLRTFIATEEEVQYGRETTAMLDGSSLEPLQLEWVRQQVAGLPDEIELYKTVSELSGRKFQAWYAVADLSTGNVELRVQLPPAGSGQTIDQQAGDDCYVLINGGYFSFSDYSHDGIAVLEGIARGEISDQRGSWTSGQEAYDWWYHVTRGTFGVDADGKPAIYWAGMNNSQPAYYAHPLPTVCGEAQYAATNAERPSVPVDWKPQYALSAGPVILKNGECPIDGSMTDKGYWLTNYELWTEVFSASYCRDQTVAGYRPDGKVVLLICDGDNASVSRGATHREAAAILKSLGCTDAIKLDGGGSTGMMVCGTHVNDQTNGNRAVVSTLGFFKK